MKKIWLLTTLLVCSLLLTGCNNHQYEEEFSEYWLLQWPNGTITLEDFKKAWTVVDPENFEEWEMCNTPELACVPIILKDDNTLITPHEFNTANIEEWRDDNIYFTDLKTFHKVTWLKEASPEYVQQYSNLYSFDPYVKFYKTKEEREAMLKEKLENQTIEEPAVEEPTYEILEWTWYMWCIWWCEDWSDEEYVEWYYYRYTNPELWLRITTPAWDGWNYNEGFRIKRETPIFKLVDNTIYSLEYDYASNWSISDAEFIKVYDKDPSISLENLLKEQYQNCIINKVESKNLRNFHWFWAYFYDIKSDRWLRENNCNAREEWEWWSLVFYVESKDENKYYKVWVNDWCAPWPCSIFWKIELL